MASSRALQHQCQTQHLKVQMEAMELMLLLLLPLLLKTLAPPSPLSNPPLIKVVLLVHL